MNKPVNDKYANRKREFIGFLHILILILSIFLIVSISIDTFKNISFLNQPEYMDIQLYICIFFMLDFFVECFLSKDKWKFIKYNFVFFLVSIPYLNILQFYNIDLPMSVVYYVRFVPLLRGGFAMVIVVSWLSKSKVSSLFTSYITMLIASVYFSSLIFFVQEHSVNPTVKDYSDALWWAWMDVTTVGSNIYAITLVGKVLSVLLAALGMMTFPIFTVYITSLFQQTRKNPEVQSQKDVKIQDSQQI